MRAPCLALLIVSLTAVLHGQDLKSTSAAQQACGPAGVEYQRGDRSAPASPLPAVPDGKALVYLVQLQGIFGGSCIGECARAMRFGLDGEWKGALWGNSFLSAAVDPGDHHLCAAWQSREKRFEQLVALQGLHAEAGKTYYYGVRAWTEGGESGYYEMEIEPLDPDQARMLLEAYPLSTAKPKIPKK